MWQTIVQQGGDTKWEFWNGSAFADADVSGSDSMMSALEQAFADGDNDWSSVTINAMTKANWTDTGGWSTSIDTIDWAVALTADGDDLPEFDKVTFTYDQAAVSLSLVTTSWEAYETNPDHAYCMLMIKPNEAFTINTDLRAYVSMDDGSNYEQINFDTSPFREIGDKDFYRGDHSGLTPRADKTMRLKVVCDKDIEIHAVALGVKYS